MGLICLSFSHKNSPIAFRERIHFDSDAVANACARFRCGDAQESSLIEMCVLSTCNRTEIYAFTSDHKEGPNQQTGEFHVNCQGRQKLELLNFVSQARGVSINELSAHANWYHGLSAAEHMARVACGLKSMVLGEPQILGQVGDAMRLGLAMNSAGPVLTKLFQVAIACGRQARTDTEIGFHSANISTLAVNSAERELGSLAGKPLCYWVPVTWQTGPWSNCGGVKSLRFIS